MSSNNAVKQQDYRERKKEKMIVELMKSQTIGRAKATRIITEKIREQGRLQRQRNRLQNKGAVVVPKTKPQKSISNHYLMRKLKK